MDITPREVAETLSMVSEQNLDLRTITMGISLMGCADEDMDRICEKVYDKITHTAEHLVSTAEDLESEYGIPIANKRVSVTPIAQIAAACPAADLSPVARTMDRAAETLGIDFMGGFSALVQKGIGTTDRKLIDSVPEALASTAPRRPSVWSTPPTTASQRRRPAARIKWSNCSPNRRSRRSSPRLIG